MKEKLGMNLTNHEAEIEFQTLHYDHLLNLV